MDLNDIQGMVCFPSRGLLRGIGGKKGIFMIPFGFAVVVSFFFGLAEREVRFRKYPEAGKPLRRRPLRMILRKNRSF